MSSQALRDKDDCIMQRCYHRKILCRIYDTSLIYTLNCAKLVIAEQYVSCLINSSLFFGCIYINATPINGFDNNIIQHALQER